LHIKDLIKKFPDKTLDYSALDLKIYRGNRIAIQGPIGVGKSTLLKLIAGSLRPDSGEVRFGYRVDMGYYAQEMVDLNKSLSVIQEISKSSMGSSEQKLRDHLGVFMFRGDDVFKPVSVLSYGERSRLMIAKLALEGYNFLLLDEPTNHLDLEVKRSLRDMLYGYEGTILIVSHDEKFLKGIGLDKTILLPDGEVFHN
jgi:ATP-binding cassette subfamily F protein 3